MSSFSAAFFGAANRDITERKQYIRARVDEDRSYLREQGLKRQAGIAQQRGAYEEAARSLIRAGADERTVLGTLEMDPQGLMEVFQRTSGDNSITGSNLNDMMVIAEDYRGESTMDEILSTILPVAQAMPNDTDPVTTRKRSLGAWLGLDVGDALDNEVYNQQIVGGMTGDQIMSSLNLPITATGTNRGGVTFDFNRAAPLSAQAIRAHVATVNEEYNLAPEIASLESALAETPADQQEAVRDRIDALKNADSLSGASRLNAIFALGIEPGETTMILADRFGAQLFDPINGFSGSLVEQLLGAPAEEADGGRTGEALGSTDDTTPIITTELPPPVDSTPFEDADEAQSFINSYDWDSTPGTELTLVINGQEIKVDKSFVTAAPTPTAPVFQSIREGGREVTPTAEGEGLFDKRGNSVNRWGEDVLRPALMSFFGTEDEAEAIPAEVPDELKDLVRDILVQQDPGVRNTMIEQVTRQLGALRVTPEIQELLINISKMRT